jgi:hypothetical protein
MPAKLRPDAGRSLRQLFGDLVWRHFLRDVQLEEPHVANYVSELMTDFVHVDNLYRVRNALGARLEDVGAMPIESNPLLGASSFDRERAVRKHVGDYTLFMAGLFPESVARTPRARRPSLDLFVDFIKAGKESYAIVSSFDQFEYRDEAPLFRRLSESFELCVLGLNLVKQDLEQLQQKHYGRLKEHLADNPSPPTQ